MQSPALSENDAVYRTLEVKCSAQHAFEVFAQNMGSWWPSEHHLGDQPFRNIEIEPFEGGQWYEIDHSGNRCPWGRVLAYQPPDRLLLAWHLGTSFTYNPDAARSSEVELRFTRVAAELTRVDFEHRHLRRHGAGYEELTRQVGAEGGWSSILNAYILKASAPT